MPFHPVRSLPLNKEMALLVVSLACAGKQVHMAAVRIAMNFMCVYYTGSCEEILSKKMIL